MEEYVDIGEHLIGVPPSMAGGDVFLGSDEADDIAIPRKDVDALIEFLAKYSTKYQGINAMSKSSSDLLRTSAPSPTAQAWGEEG